jgi:hypothetical protein
MTPKEKAEELIKRFNKVEIFISIEPCNIETDLKNVDCDANKQCALIAVDEIINSIVIIDLTAAENQFTYWEKVKEEIENL